MGNDLCRAVPGRNPSGNVVNFGYAGCQMRSADQIKTMMELAPEELLAERFTELLKDDAIALEELCNSLAGLPVDLVHELPHSWRWAMAGILDVRKRLMEQA